MIQSTASQSEWFKQAQVLLFGICSLALLLFALAHRHSWANPIRLTTAPHASAAEVDSALQQAAITALGQRDGAIIVMDPQTGRMRAVVNPDLAFRKSFAPGSTIKPFVTLAAMRSGLIDAESHTLCRQRYAHHDFATVCSHPTDLPPFDAAEALAHSCNYYFGKLGERLSEDSFDATARSFGLGQSPEATPEEGQPGGIEWSSQAALGEGPYTQVTPAQLVTAYAALANGGRLLTPKSGKPESFDAGEVTHIPIDDAHRAVILEGLRGAVRFGTAEKAGLASLPLHIFGKTGTSTPLKGFRTQGWFVGFAADPDAAETSPQAMRVAVLVFLKRAHGADAAALARPIFAEFARVAGQEREFGKDVKTSEVNLPPSPRLSVSTSPRLPVSSSTVRVHLVRENTTIALPFEDYVLGVVAAEGSIEDEPEALKALAVAARSYALKNRRRHQREGFDFCTTTHCQLFHRDKQGPERYATRAFAAVRSSAGEVLLDERGNPAESYFGASCGGETANLGSLWGGNAPPHLRGVPDEYCAAMPHHDWTDVIARSQLLTALRSDARTDVGGRLEDVIVSRRDESDRAELITLVGERHRTVRGWDFKIIVGRALGWNKLKSSRFTVKRVGTDFVFRGSGFGHGLGLCQEGAHVMAELGVNYRQILAKYFPGTTLARDGRFESSFHGTKRSPANATDTKQRGWQADLLPGEEAAPPSAAVSLRSSPARLNLSNEHFRISYPAVVERREVEIILGILGQARADLLRRTSRASTSVSGLPTISVNINGTTGDFVGRTGQPWWVAAATRGNRIELQPPAVLKRRGALATTLRHELAHAFIGAAGHGRTPRWLEEGFALHLAGEGRMISRYLGKGTLTLADLESKLGQSGSAEEMRALYAAAYREVSRLIQAEGEAKVWQRVARS